MLVWSGLEWRGHTLLHVWRRAPFKAKPIEGKITVHAIDNGFLLFGFNFLCLTWASAAALRASAGCHGWAVFSYGEYRHLMAGQLYRLILRTLAGQACGIIIPEAVAFR